MINFSYFFRLSPSTVDTIENMNYGKIDFDLVVKVITHISLNMEVGVHQRLKTYKDTKVIAR